MSQEERAERRSLDILMVDDALRLARQAAERGGVPKAITESLYEKVVLDEISVLEYLALLKREVKDEALGSVIENIQKNIYNFK